MSREASQASRKKNLLQWFQHITIGMYLPFAATLTALVFFHTILERFIWDYDASL